MSFNVPMFVDMYGQLGESTDKVEGKRQQESTASYQRFQGLSSIFYGSQSSLILEQ